MSKCAQVAIDKTGNYLNFGRNGKNKLHVLTKNYFSRKNIIQAKDKPNKGCRNSA